MRPFIGGGIRFYTSIAFHGYTEFDDSSLNHGSALTMPDDTTVGVDDKEMIYMSIYIHHGCLSVFI